MSKINCPYCYSDCGTHDGGPREFIEAECEDCGKRFLYSAELEIQCRSFEVPCLNGEPHDWRERASAPRYAGVGIYNCRHCGKRETRWVERLEKLKAMALEDWEKPIVAKLIAQAEQHATEGGNE